MAGTSLWQETVRTARSLMRGLGVTFREMAYEKPVTIRYPEERAPVPAWFRGMPVQKTDLTTGEYKCTSCGQCVEACPTNVITLAWHQDENKKKVVDRYAIDMSRCLVCNYCVEACPFDALVMSNDYELSTIDPETMVYEFEDLLRLGLKYSRVEEAAKKTRGEPPPWVFAGITGATEADILDPRGYLGRDPINPRTRKEYIAGLHARLGIPDDGEREAAAESRTTRSAAAHTITRDTPVHTPVVNPHPKNVSAAAGPARIASPKAVNTAPAEADEVYPDQAPKPPSRTGGGRIRNAGGGGDGRTGGGGDGGEVH